MNQSENTSPKSGQRAGQRGREPLKEGELPERQHGLGGVRGGKEAGNYPLSTKSRTGVSWMCMMNRCYNPRVINYKNYGGRGIFVCVGLQRGPHAIQEEIGLRAHGMSLERRDNEQAYTCGRCGECVKAGRGLNIKWATRREQAMNKRNTVKITIDGVTKTTEEWAEIAGLPCQTVYRRFKHFGWTGAQILSNSRHRFITIGGETKRLCDWARVAGVGPAVILARIERGWVEERLLLPPRTHQRINELAQKVSSVVGGVGDGAQERRSAPVADDVAGAP